MYKNLDYTGPGPGKYNISVPFGKNAIKYSMRMKLYKSASCGDFKSPGPGAYSAVTKINPNGTYIVSKNENVHENRDVTDYRLPPRGFKIIQEYREKRAAYEKLMSVVRDTLAQSIKENNLYVNAIEARVKTEESIAGKLLRKGGKYSDLLSLTDVVGVRVITCYNDEVDKIAALVGRLFEIDWENSIDKRRMHEVHSFGYNSLHYICRLPKSVCEDPAFPELNEIRFEVQMRSALQHVWAVLDHDTGYKSGFEVPKEYQRNLSRLAGMLELIDEQFCVIRTGISNYRRHVHSLVSSGRFDEVALDGDSFGNYLELHPFDPLNKRIAAINQAEIYETSLVGFLKVFRFLGFTTLGDVEKMIQDCSEDAYHLAAFQLGNTDLDIINSSLAVVNLCAVYLLKRRGGILELTRCLDELNGATEKNRRRAEKMFELAKKLAFMDSVNG